MSAARGFPDTSPSHTVKVCNLQQRFAPRVRARYLPECSCGWSGSAVVDEFTATQATWVHIRSVKAEHGQDINMAEILLRVSEVFGRDRLDVDHAMVRAGAPAWAWYMVLHEIFASLPAGYRDATWREITNAFTWDELGAFVRARATYRDGAV